ncbi:MAG: 3-dehydroquinate synthase II [Candidatus Hodarchaeota archaeon]
MKKIIINFETRSSNFKELVQEAFNKNFLNFLVSESTFSEFKGIERLNFFTKDLEVPAKYLIYENKEELQNKIAEKGISGEILGFYKKLKSKEDEREVVELSKTGQLDLIIISAKNWKIIPFENLIAEMHSNEIDLIAEVEDVKEAELMFKTLEIGVDGILIKPNNVNELTELKKLLFTSFKIDLIGARVIKINNIPESDRVCVDTTSLLHPGEGLLVGSTAKGFCLIHAEVFETQFVASRPFRVNAGDVSAYILVPNDDPEKVYRTKYLSELQGGDKVLIVNSEGFTRIVSVGRVKIETRPMLRFELEVTKGARTIPIYCICQNAETISLIDINGNAKSVVDIKVGDEVLVHIGPGATHFGTAIKETIIEK